MTRLQRAPGVFFPLILGSFLVLLTTASAPPRPADVEEVLRTVSRNYKTLRSYDFAGVMTLSITMDGVDQHMDLRVRLAGVPPDRRRVEIESPFMGTTVVTRGDSTWTYSKEHNEYTREAVVPVVSTTQTVRGAADAGPIASLLETYGALTERADQAALVGETVLQTGGRPARCVILALRTARAPDSTSAAAADICDTLWIDADRHLVLRESHDEQWTAPVGSAVTHRVIAFDVLRANEPIESSVFTFVPPAGAKKVLEIASLPVETSELVGQVAPGFTLEDLRGKERRMERMRGNVVLLDFWATWCGPCRDELPIIEKLHREFRDQGLVVLGVNAEPTDVAERFARENRYTFPTLVDAKNALPEKYHVRGLPTVIIIDRDGRVATQFLGAKSEATLREALAGVGIR
jgi:peroxiredoxin/outer membrane lipoprotein-sorting protein